MSCICKKVRIIFGYASFFHIIQCDIAAVRGHELTQHSSLVCLSRPGDHQTGMFFGRRNYFFCQVTFNSSQQHLPLADPRYNLVLAECLLDVKSKMGSSEGVIAAKAEFLLKRHIPA